MLTRAVETYLAVRRAAGFALRNTSYHLRSFAAFSEARKRHYISTEIAIAWAGLAPSLPERARRLGTIIRFARYLRAEDDRHEVPPAIFGRVGSTRPTPYILTPEQSDNSSKQPHSQDTKRFAAQPTAHCSHCWLALDYECRKRSGCDRLTSRQMVW